MQVKTAIGRQGKMKTLVSIANAFFSSSGDMPQISCGVSLMSTIEALSLEAYFSHQTTEGYSVAEIIGHLMYCKWYLARAIADDFGDDYPFAPGVQGFDCDWVESHETREMQQEYIRKVHGRLMAEVAAGKPDKYRVDLPERQMNVFDAIHWISQHDIYHLGQIRNMGIGSLAEANVTRNRGKIA